MARFNGRFGQVILIFFIDCSISSIFQLADGTEMKFKVGDQHIDHCPTDHGRRQKARLLVLKVLKIPGNRLFLAHRLYERGLT